MKRVIICLLLLIPLVSGITPEECSDKGGDYHDWSGRCCPDSQTQTDGDIFGQPDVYLCHNNKWKNAQQYDFQIITVYGTDYVSNSERWFKCDASRANKGIEIPLSASFGKQSKASSFICARLGSSYEDYEFVECCEDCTNDINKIAKPGSPVSTIEDFLSKGGFDTISYNAAHGVIEKEFSVGKFDDLSTYTHLGILIKMSDNFYGTIEMIDKNGFVLFNEEIMDYAQGTPQHDKFFHIIIPVTAVYRNIAKIKITVDLDRLALLSPISNTITTERIYLLRQPADFFCSNGAYSPDSFPHRWITDLDDSREGYDSQPVSRDACMNNYFTWTGTSCCGDDMIVGNPEYYNDTEKTCWAGMGLDNQAASEILITYTTKNTPKPKNLLCYSNDCSFAGRYSTYVVSSDKQLTAVFGEQTKVVSGSTEIDYPRSALWSYDTHLGVMGHEGSLYACEYESEVTNSSICEVHGDWFCTFEGFKNEQSGGFASSQRDTIRTIMPGFNLLKNPSFEVAK